MPLNLNELLTSPLTYNGTSFDRGGSALLADLATGLERAASLLNGLVLQARLSLAFAPQNGLRHYLKVMQATDQTFKNLYHWNWFDAALLLPYFAVMIVLAIYGLHRYTLVYLYFKHAKNDRPDPPRYFDELPRVTVQLPIYNEQFVVDRLLDAVCAMDYPREKLEIQVLDDSTDETEQVASALVERYAALGHPIEYIHRTNRHGYKAGALEAGLKAATGEFIAIFDADFVPPPDWLMKVIHHFAEPEIGMVQTRWTHLNRDYSMLTQIEAILLDGHFVLEHGARARSGDFFNFNASGTLHVTRDGAAGGFDLARGDALGLHRLEAVGAEIEREAALGHAVDAAFVRLAVFRAIWAKHDPVLSSSAIAAAGRLVSSARLSCAIGSWAMISPLNTQTLTPQVP